MTGYIYCITNKLDGAKYIGQTRRDIATRFQEHLWDYRGKSKLHTAIQKYGRENFSVEEVEKVEFTDSKILDEREKYWIKYYNTQENGYNILPGGIIHKNYLQVLIVEKNLVVDSVEELSRVINKHTSWSISFIKDKIQEVKDTDKTFLGYHYASYSPVSDDEYADYNELTEWAVALHQDFRGKHIYCQVLEKEFSTIAEAAAYLVNNNYYTGVSKTPIQSLVTSIGKQLHGKSKEITVISIPDIVFEWAPGTTKQQGGDSFAPKKVYCPQLEQVFPSIAEAGQYFIDNKIWTGIKVKTAKLRISDVARGYFSDYKGYTFVYQD